MRKLLFVLSLVILFSCSSSSDDDNSSNLFNPPSWILGTWSNEIASFVFKKNDFCTRVSNLESCLNDNLLAAKKTGVSVNVDEEISENEYKFSYTIQGQTSYYHFKKITNTKIEFIDPVQGQPNTPLFKR